MAYKFSIGDQVLSGSITMKQGLTVPAGGTVALEDDALQLTDVDIDGGTNYGAQTLHKTQDKFPMSDNGTNKSITFSDLEDSIFANVSGDATVAGGGALTIANDAVEQAMIADDAVGADQLASNAVVNASVASGAAIALNKLAAVNSGNIIVGNASNQAASVAMSGDVAISNAGLTTIQAGSVEHGMLADDIISGQTELAHADIADSNDMMIHDGGVVKKVGVDSLQNHYFGKVSGDATIADGGALTLAGAQTNISSLLRTDIKIGEDDQTKIDFETADEIHFYASNAEQVYVADGIFGPETNNDVDLGSSAVKFKDLFLAGTASIAGDLLVQGTLVTLDVATVGITGSFSFEGSTADGNETVLGVVDPTGDNTINLANSSGTLIPFAVASTTVISATPAEINYLDNDNLEAADFTKLANVTATATEINYLDNDNLEAADFTKLANVTATAGEINYLDITTLGTAAASKALTIKGDSTWTVAGMTCANLGTVTTIDINGGTIDNVTLAGTNTVNIGGLDIDGAADINSALVDADLFIVDNGAGGTNQKCAMSRLKTYIGGGTLSVNQYNTGSVAQDLNGAPGLWCPSSEDASSSNAVSLHLSGSWSDGDKLIIKAPGNAATNNLTIYASGSGEDGQLIDGESQLVLESNFAAVTLVYAGTGNWFIY